MRDRLFGDPGGGEFMGAPREFVLQDANLNLWEQIRDDVSGYFKKHDITWWKGGEDKAEPTGHLLSSQIACVNHLFPVRKRQDVAAAILKNVRNDITDAVDIEDGYVAFEVIGKDNYLGEKLHTRGTNRTSVDAAMVGTKADGKNLLVLIEWKYTKSYNSEPKYIPRRQEIYDPLLDNPDCPIASDNHEALYYEPFYQMMRQTLLGWKMVQAGEYGCDEYIHLHVIPRENRELLDRVTSPGLKGDTMSEAWKGVLKEPGRYIVISPEDLLKPAMGCPDTDSFMNYLRERYW